MNFRRLPAGYRHVESIDFARDRRQMKALLVLSLVLTAATILPGIALAPKSVALRDYMDNWWILAVTLLLHIAYIPLHELTHGVVMYALSGVKPRYGLRLPYAWCGSAVWFDRRGHIVTALAPVAVWGVAISALALRLDGLWFWPLWTVQIANTSGSAGDIYTAWHLARMRGDLLIQDTGTRMRIVRRVIQN